MPDNERQRRRQQVIDHARRTAHQVLRMNRELTESRYGCECTGSSYVCACCKSLMVASDAMANATKELFARVGNLEWENQQEATATTTE